MRVQTFMAQVYNSNDEAILELDKMTNDFLATPSIRVISISAVSFLPGGTDHYVKPRDYLPTIVRTVIYNTDDKL